MSSRKTSNQKTQPNEAATGNNLNQKENAAIKPPTKTKAGNILAQLRRVNGASINQLTASTGWQAHSLRAVISGLRKQGISIVTSKAKNGATVYRAERS